MRMKTSILVSSIFLIAFQITHGSDDKIASVPANQMRQITIAHPYLRLPIKNDGPRRHLTIFADGKANPGIEIQLADGTPDWWAWKDVSAWQGKEITLQTDHLPEGSSALRAISQADKISQPTDLYHEPLRPQFHFSSRRGWLNDPNGLVFYRGEYHLFYQHNPYGCDDTGDNMHWGHAVSKDLVHWEELGDVLYPDELGPMWSGSAVVDRNNDSGFGKDGQPPLLLFYTAAEHPTTQCMAYSLDGRTFTKYADNPVVKQITEGNRDPKVFWHEPSKKWVMAMYVGQSTDTVHFLNSTDLRKWTDKGYIPFTPECPDLFELPVDGNAQNKKWVLTSASSNYRVGKFSGTMFTPETPQLRGHSGDVSYAAQTYNDAPDGRRIHIGWLRASSPGMPFNQEMSIPIELKLVTTPEGPRLTWTPLEELKTLRSKTWHIEPLTLNPGDSNPLADIHGELLELRTKFSPQEAQEVRFNVRGASVVYDTITQELLVNNGISAKAPLREGTQEITIYLDRTSIEVFADGGLVYIPQAFIPKPEDTTIGVTVQGGAVKIENLDVHQLQSAW